MQECQSALSHLKEEEVSGVNIPPDTTACGEVPAQLFVTKAMGELTWFPVPRSLVPRTRVGRSLRTRLHVHWLQKEGSRRRGREEGRVLCPKVYFPFSCTRQSLGMRLRGERNGRRRGGGSGEESIKCGRLALPKHTSCFCAPDGECHSEGSD